MRGLIPPPGGLLTEPLLSDVPKTQLFSPMLGAVELSALGWGG